MAAHIDTSSAEDSVSSIFKDMHYGPAPESDNVVKKWIEDHGQVFGHFIGGKWHKPEDRKTYDTKDPVTGEILASTTQGTADDIDLACTAASAAYPQWSALAPHERAKHLYSIARHIQKHARLFSVLESLDNGKTIRESRDCDIPIVIRHFYHYAGWAQLMDTEMSKWKSIGVVGAIVPWNFPLMLLTWKVCPALAMGNTVVLKPATYTRLSALLMAEVCSEAGLPDGVFNVVTGDGKMGSYLATHPKVNKIGFTGSTEVGKILRQKTAGTGKKISLELGGKSPVVVFDSADLDSAVEGLVDAIWFNQGQVCSAGSKCLVQDTIYDKLVSKLKDRLSHFRVGRSLDKCMDMGPIVDKSQMRSLQEYIDSARNEGAEVYQNSACILDGDFFPPTIITNVQTTSRVVQEELFGPVLVILPFRTAKEAVSLANNTQYGLAGSVWTEKISLGLEVCLGIQAGSVWLNCHNIFDAASGFGGYKQSGYGRDGGKEGLYEYVKPKWDTRDMYLPLSEVPSLDKFGETCQARPTLDRESSQPNGPRSVDRTYKMYYGGAQKRPDAPYARPIVSHTGVPIAHVGEGNRKDVRNAVEAAHKAAPGWGKRAAYNRAQIVFYVAENLQIRKQEVAKQLSDMTGKSHEDSITEVDASIKRLFHWAAYADKYGGTVQETTLYGATVKIHEPVGVIAIICPNNFPLLGFVSLFASAIVRGNCIVMVPSQDHPLAALDLYQVFDTSDVPGGVINLLTGDSDHLTKHLADHQDVQALWYFGSSRTAATYVEFKSAENLKRTWVDHGFERDWTDAEQGEGEEFMYHATQVKNIWIPMGNIYAN